MPRIAPLLLCLVAFPVVDDDRPAATIVAEIDAIVVPDPSRARANSEHAKVATLNARKARTKRAALIRELDQVHPDHPDLARLLPVRWRDLWAIHQVAGLPDEIDAAVARRPDDAAFAIEAAYAKGFMTASTRLQARPPNFAGALEAIDAFLEQAPNDARGAAMLETLLLTRGDAGKGSIEDQILEHFPDSHRARMIAGKRRAAETIGKPFHLGFDDFLTGTPVSSGSTLKGKIVVVVFWTSWCLASTQELDKLKLLYPRFAPRGVEFLAVNLDKGTTPESLARIRAAAARQNLPWPQYRPEKGWNGEFAEHWGIEAVPTIFLIDADGNLADRTAWGKLEERLGELLIAGPRRITRP